MDFEKIKPTIILQGVTGSTANGCSLSSTNSEESLADSDRDELAVCVEPIELAITLGQPFEQYIHRTAAIREHTHDAKSQPGDLDLTVFSLRKFCRLAAAGNPSVLLLLFTPDVTRMDALGSQLRDLKDNFISKEAGHRFLGYMHGQKQRLLGEKGQKRVKRPDLEEKFGFDTKYAYHILRLGMQGIELMQTGSLKLPMSVSDRAFLLGVRTGELSFNQVLTEAGNLELKLKSEIENSFLPEEANRPVIEDFIQGVYLDRWKARQPIGKLLKNDTDKFGWSLVTVIPEL